LEGKRLRIRIQLHQVVMVSLLEKGSLLLRIQLPFHRVVSLSVGEELILILIQLQRVYSNKNNNRQFRFRKKTEIKQKKKKKWNRAGSILISFFEEMLDALGEGFYGEEYDAQVNLVDPFNTGKIIRSAFLAWYTILIEVSNNKNDEVNPGSSNARSAADMIKPI